MIAKQVENYLSGKNVDLKVFSEKTGLTVKHLQRIWDGQEKMTVEEYEKVCTVLELPFDYFFNLDKQEKKKDFLLREIS